LPTAVAGHLASLSRHAGHPLCATSLTAIGIAYQENRQFAEQSGKLRRLLVQLANDTSAAIEQSLLVDARFAQAQAEMRSGKLDAAHRSLVQLLSSAPHHELARPARLARANVRFQMGGYADGLNDIKAVLVTRPPRAMRSEALLLRGMCQASLGLHADAIESYNAVLTENGGTETEIIERALHKRALALFALGEFADAERAFTVQLTRFGEGPLSADARIMIAESRLARRDYEAAFETYQTALKSDGGSPEVREIALLHAAQTANQLDKWAACLEFLQRCEREFPDNCWTAEIRCERGWAWYHQDELPAAWREFQFVASTRTDVLAARARFMMGEIQLARSRYDDAALTFLTVAYGYGGTEAPREFHRWQAEALFEAARCLEQTRRPDLACKLYHDLVTCYPDCRKASLARVALDGLKTR
jgi:TolA-binding protein